jgi:hypothetical protein
MDPRPIVIGTHAFFAREATSTSSRTVKPAANAASWIKFGVIEESGAEPTSEEKEVWAPSPGQLVLHDVIEIKRGLSFKFKVKEMSKLMFELLFGTLDLSSGTTNIQYNPLEGVAKKGWLKVQHYGHDNALINVVDVWTHLKIAGEVTFGEDIVSFPVEARVLHSTLNTGTLNPSA